MLAYWICMDYKLGPNPYSVCNFLTGVFKHSSLSPFCETKTTPLQRHKWGGQTEGQRHPLGIHGTIRASLSHPTHSPGPHSSWNQQELQRAGVLAVSTLSALSYSVINCQLMTWWTRSWEPAQLKPDIFSGKLALTQKAISTQVCWMPQNSQTNMGNCRGLQDLSFLSKFRLD